MTELVIISGKQYSGKDALADLLLEALPGFIKMPLARAIKQEFSALYGLTPQEVEADKATYRSALISLGQRRRLQNPDYWIEQVTRIPGAKIVSDVRLKRELEYFKFHGAFCIRVEADRAIRETRGTLVKEDDPTECELDNTTGWDAAITNNGSLEDLRQKARELAAQITAGQ